MTTDVTVIMMACLIDLILEYVGIADFVVRGLVFSVAVGLLWWCFVKTTASKAETLPTSTKSQSVDATLPPPVSQPLDKRKHLLAVHGKEQTIAKLRYDNEDLWRCLNTRNSIRVENLTYQLQEKTELSEQYIKRSGHLEFDLWVAKRELEKAGASGETVVLQDVEERARLVIENRELITKGMEDAASLQRQLMDAKKELMNARMEAVFLTEENKRLKALGTQYVEENERLRVSQSGLQAQYDELVMREAAITAERDTMAMSEAAIAAERDDLARTEAALDAQKNDVTRKETAISAQQAELTEREAKLAHDEEELSVMKLSVEEDKAEAERKVQESERLLKEESDKVLREEQKVQEMQREMQKLREDNERLRRIVEGLVGGGLGGIGAGYNYEEIAPSAEDPMDVDTQVPQPLAFSSLTRHSGMLLPRKDFQPCAPLAEAGSSAAFGSFTNTSIFGGSPSTSVASSGFGGRSNSVFGDLPTNAVTRKWRTSLLTRLNKPLWLSTTLLPWSMMHRVPFSMPNRWANGVSFGRPSVASLLTADDIE
ncbi:hypothetical protein BC829DRAFT_486110 [Chytridium lagenaria]|nr:hypothetical protein BC829DRAFT_486110 [Chytridium lagenaria]